MFMFRKLYILELLRCVQLRFLTLHDVTSTLCCFTLCSIIDYLFIVELLLKYAKPTEFHRKDVLLCVSLLLDSK
jgi:hypothetical protein